LTGNQIGLLADNLRLLEQVNLSFEGALLFKAGTQAGNIAGTRSVIETMALTVIRFTDLRMNLNWTLFKLWATTLLPLENQSFIDFKYEKNKINNKFWRRTKINQPTVALTNILAPIFKPILQVLSFFNSPNNIGQKATTYKTVAPPNTRETRMK
jgi:hypothetical protein